MRIRRGYDPGRGANRGCVAAIGNFDGVHLGHQALLSLLAERGREQAAPTTVVCFEPHPREFFSPGDAPARLMRLRDKAEALAALGIDELRVLRFGEALSRLSAEAFIEQVLVGALGARQVVIGEDFRFGHERRGDAAMLARAGRVHGFGVDAVPARLVHGQPASSTRVRQALAAGRLDEARAILGRDFRISGRVIPGERLGHALGIPTANMRLYRRVSPVAGIFAVRVSGAGLEDHPGVASVGTRPTVGGREWLLETHLFDYTGDLYRQRLDVDFVARLRDEVQFPDLESLAAQMQADARAARELLDA